MAIGELIRTHRHWLAAALLVLAWVDRWLPEPLSLLMILTALAIGLAGVPLQFSERNAGLKVRYSAGDRIFVALALISFAFDIYARLFTQAGQHVLASAYIILGTGLPKPRVPRTDEATA